MALPLLFSKLIFVMTTNFLLLLYFMATTTAYARKFSSTVGSYDLKSTHALVHLCEGGQIPYAFDYIRTSGIRTEIEYPYNLSKEGTCKLPRTHKSKSFFIRGYENVPANDENSLMKAVAQQPVSVGIASLCPQFRSYAKGILDEDCEYEYLDHAVTIVRYGMDGSSKEKHWIVKNSWGGDWGENGYMRIKIKGEKGLFGINMEASIPLY